MAKRIVWSQRARSERFAILEYWIKRNKSKIYSTKLNELFVKAVLTISKYPKIGKRTDVKNVRVKIVRDYLVIYEITEREIIILTIFDSRQDPNLIIKRISK
jgi:toxin YoeB